MMSLWLTQIAAVMRIEIRKSFFARRGLWIYLLALAPVVIFAMGAFVSRHVHVFDSSGSSSMTKATEEQLDSIHTDMTREQVIAALGEPTFTRTRNTRTFDDDGKPIVVQREELRYYSDRRSLSLVMQDGVVREVVSRGRGSFQQTAYVFAGVFQFLFIRLLVFFGCLGIFMNLFRGEMLDKSLHYYLLSPIRREVLLVGKFLAGIVAACVIFTASAALQLTAFLSAFDSETISRFFSQEHGASQVVAYLGVTALACLGYGSVFLGAGLLFRNPIFPAAVVLIWEAANPLLPALLKKFSVIYYLKALCPVPIPTDPGMPALMKLLVSNGDPISSYLAVLGLFALAVLVLWASSLKVRKLEINYTTE